jgi:beta-lactamase regulating signal transducer with metallopeptidase domain
VFSWLLYNTLCALPLALLALVARRALRAAPAVEHGLWLLVLVRLVLPPFGPLFDAATSSSTASNIVSSAEPGLGDVLVARVTRVLGPSWSSWGADVLLWAFLATLALVVLRELARARAVERCVRRAVPADRELERRVRAVAGDLGVSAPRIRVSAEASGPFLWSLRRPVLVLPEAPAAADAGAAPAPTVLAHEFAHLARRDHWTAWLELVVQGFHFWNPLFWLARRRLHLAAELAADQWVVRRFPAERRAFATALVDTAERAQLRAFVPRAVQAIGMDRRDFEERLVRILKGDARAKAPRVLAALVVSGALPSLPGLAAPTLAEFRAALPALPAGIDLDTWRRRLATAEASLAADPDDGAARMQRGMALLGLGRAAEALADFERQEQLGFRAPVALYNQACTLVRLGELDAALVCLLRASDAGMDVAAYVRADPDLAPLRAHPGFADLEAAR